jgi:hypothetical protein
MHPLDTSDGRSLAQEQRDYYAQGAGRGTAGTTGSRGSGRGSAAARAPDLGLLSPGSAALGEQGQVNCIGHRQVALVVGVQVIAAVIGR